MLLLYFKTSKTSFRKHRFSLEGISVKFVDWSKAQIVNISAKRPKMKKNESTLFSGTFKVSPVHELDRNDL